MKIKVRFTDEVVEKGGPGSGNHGHSGLKGVHGGSSGGGGKGKASGGGASGGKGSSGSSVPADGMYQSRYDKNKRVSMPVGWGQNMTEQQRNNKLQEIEANDSYYRDTGIRGGAIANYDPNMDFIVKPSNTTKALRVLANDEGMEYGEMKTAFSTALKNSSLSKKDIDTVTSGLAGNLPSAWNLESAFADEGFGTGYGEILEAFLIGEQSLRETIVERVKIPKIEEVSLFFDAVYDEFY